MQQQCPICHEAITKETGITTMSCSHSFHLKCIGTWILKSTSCPCCRSEISEHEKLPVIRARTMSYEDDDIWEIIRVDVPILQLPPQIVRLRFSMLDPNAREFVPGQH